MLLAKWSAEQHNFALAIVISTWGSSPRQRGSLMAIRDDGLIEGSVSGGCVEASVIETASQLMTTGGAERLDFGVADETAWEVGLSCGGKISVWVCSKSAIQPELITDAASSIAARQPVYIDCLVGGQMMQAGHKAEDNQFDVSTDCFHLAILPRPRLIIIGAVHISQHLAPMANATGFDVLVIDPRTGFANPARFPEIEVIDDWPQDVLDAASLDHHTAIVTLTHDPKIDDEALKIALRGNPYYLASLGSRKTHEARKTRLREAGFTDTQIDHIKGPAGLDIGAKTPAEIAVSVLAELIAGYRAKLS